MTEIDEVRCQRDMAKAKLRPLQEENEWLRLLLRHAEEAIMAEYHLRTVSTRRADEQQGGKG